MARAAIVRSNEAPRREDTGTKYATRRSEVLRGTQRIGLAILFPGIVLFNSKW